MLYEQRLYELMLKLIPTTFLAEDQADMIHAAETWRLPYWVSSCQGLDVLV